MCDRTVGKKMVDNSWIHSDTHPKSDLHSRVMTIKVIMTISLLVIGSIITIAIHNIGSDASEYQAEGILIDVGDYHTYWTNISYSENTDDPLELLNIACTLKGYSHTVEDGVLTSITINGDVYANSSEKSWGLWYVEKGEYDYKKSDSYQISAEDYTIVTWAYMAATEVPAVAVDASSTCIYGYKSPSSIVTLSPVCTELVGAMKATTKIVGVDSSSNYPTSIVSEIGNGISIVGTYMDPSYESIMSVKPELVVCDGSQLSHKEMATTLRNSNICSIVIYDGEDFESIIKNVFILGTAMGYELRALDVIDEMQTAFDTIRTMTSTHNGYRTMITLGSYPSPYVAASSTYLNDIVGSVNGDNVFSYLNGWPQIVSEYIKSTNPDCIVILDEGRYTQDEYELMLSTLSAQWKSTNAYQNGEIYLLTGSVSDMAQRYGPRTIQLVELLARIINPDAFDDEIVVSKSIGDDYANYLSITKEMGYNG